MAREDRVELWKARIHEFRTRCESVTQWCKRHRVSRTQLYRWIRKLEQAERPAPAPTGPGWVALTVEEPTPGPSAPPIVVRVGAMAVEVRSGFDPGVLAEVLRTVKALC